MDFSDTNVEQVETNPYRAPAAEPLPNEPTTKMRLHDAATVFGCAIAGGILGMAMGIFIGAVFPGYYETVFRGATVQSVPVGAGLGLTQGTSGGFVIGIILVLIQSWYRLRWTRMFVERERLQGRDPE